MKKSSTAFSTILITMVVLISSCSNQKYAYLQKVKLDQSISKKKTTESFIGEISPKKALEIPVVSAPTSLENHQKLASNPKSNPERLNNSISVKTLVPNIGSQIFGSNKPLITKTKEIKALIKDNQRAEVLDGIDARKWMVVGLILIVIALILNIILGLGGLVYAIGGIVFLVGLLAYLFGIL